MNFMIFVLLIAVTFCESYGNEEDSTFLRLSPLDKKVIHFLEKLKKDMKTGVPMANNITMDPYKLEYQKFEFDGVKPDFVKGSISVSKLVLKELSEFEIKHVKVKIVGGFNATVSLFWPQVTLESNYEMNLTIGDKFRVFGNGNIRVDARDFLFNTSIKVNPGSATTSVTGLTWHVELGEITVKVTGLFNDSDLSEFFSGVLSDLIPDMIRDHQDDIAAEVNDDLIATINEKLSHLSMNEILGQKRF